MMIEKAPIICRDKLTVTTFPTAWRENTFDFERVLGQQRDADHIYYLQQFVKWVMEKNGTEPKFLFYSNFPFLISKEEWQALKKEAGL